MQNKNKTKTSNSDPTRQFLIVFGSFFTLGLFIYFVYDPYLRVFTFSDEWLKTVAIISVVASGILAKIGHPGLIKRITQLEKERSLKEELNNSSSKKQKMNKLDIPSVAFGQAIIFFVIFSIITAAILLCPVGSLLHRMTESEVQEVTVIGYTNTCRKGGRFSERFSCIEIVEPEKFQGLSGIRIYGDYDDSHGRRVIESAKIKITESWFGYYSARYQGLDAKDIKFWADQEGYRK